MAKAAMPNDVERIPVTPQMAHEWLGYNTHNRRLRERVVNAYAADMAAGAWQWNGESIKFATDGTLLDGQHRLAAIVKADVTVPMLVVRGLPNETQDTVDGGISRKFADVLQLRGELSCVTLAALVRRVTMWEAGFRFNFAGTVTTNAQMLQTLEKHPQLRAIAGAARNTARGVALPSSLIGFGMWLFSQIDTEDTDFFFDRLGDGQNLAKGDAIYELRRTAEASKSVRGERSETFMAAIMIKAWNAYRDGKQVALLRYKRGGANPEKFPEPH